MIAGVSAEMIMAVAALVTAGGGAWKSVAEAKKIAREVTAISGQVHNNHGSSLKDTADRIEKKVDLLETKVDAHTVELTQLRRDMGILREEALLASQRQADLEKVAHESHREIFQRLNGIEKRKAS